MNSTKRIWYFDILRIIATIAVVSIHICASMWRDSNPGDLNWDVANIVQGFIKVGVPLFVMISGALFLDKDISISLIFKKYILRILIAFAFWSLIYALVDLYKGETIKNVIISFFTGHYHMWFLYMIIGLYLIVPFLRKIVVLTKLTIYFLILSLVFSVEIPGLLGLLSLTDNPLTKIISSVTGNLNFSFALGYAGYFVLGYFLKNIDISKDKRIILYICGLVGYLFTVYFTKVTSVGGAGTNYEFQSYFTNNILIQCICVFLLAKYLIGDINISGTKGKIISTLSERSFGVYLSHILVLDFLESVLKFNELGLNPVILYLSELIIITTVSYLISILLGLIPKVSKYIC